MSLKFKKKKKNSVDLILQWVKFKQPENTVRYHEQSKIYSIRLIVFFIVISFKSGKNGQKIRK